MQSDNRKILNAFRPSRIIYPILIGLGAATYLLVKNFDRSSFEKIEWTWVSLFWIFMALMMMVVRDGAYMIRIRALTDNELNWRQSFNVIMLWEFASALAPGTSWKPFHQSHMSDRATAFQEGEVRAHRFGAGVTLERIVRARSDENLIQLQQFRAFRAVSEVRGQVRKFLPVFARADFVKDFAQAVEIGLGRARPFGRHEAFGADERE